MADAYEDDAGAVSPRRRWRAALVLLLVGFLGGLAAAGWAIGRSEPLDSFLRARFGEPTLVHPAAAPATPVRIVAVPAAPPADAVTAIALGTRVDALAARIEAIDARARAATGDADRAQSLLVAFAARRALDRGVDLGYIEGLLRERFGASQPQAVAAIIGAARQPVTLASLQTGLEQAAPSLTGHLPNESWWTSFRRGLAGMIVVRRAGTPPTDPNDRVDRAERALESGQADVALAEVARIPDNGTAAAWMISTRRYIGSRAALDRIETAALLEPEAPDAPAPDADADGDAVPEPPVAPASGPAPAAAKTAPAKPAASTDPSPRAAEKPVAKGAAKPTDQPAARMRR